MTEQIDTGSKKGQRGMSQASINMIGAMRNIAEAMQPITGRGIGYKLFTRGLIASMSRQSMAKVYRLLVKAREMGIIPWEWIVDETRSLEQASTWDNPQQFFRTVSRAYRLDFWKQQPVRVQVWSEKGTVRGVLAPVLERYGVGFMAVGGFGSATTVNNLAQDYDGRDLIVLYVGDYDPSGMHMSEVDLSARVAEYGGDHVEIRRIAMLRPQTQGLPSFPAAEKVKDPRYKWFAARYGRTCWELDAMDPNALRQCVELEIRALIEPDAWERCEVVYAAEKESIETFVYDWNERRTADDDDDE